MKLSPTDPPLPPGLLASLAASAGRPRAVLIRHGDRPPIPAGHAGFTTPLTASGERRTRALGPSLGRLDWALSSPIFRCLRTAELAGRVADPSLLLGAPGAFITDETLGGAVFAEHGTMMVVREHVATGRAWGCLRPVPEGAKRVLALLSSRLVEGSGVAVSHDAVVIPVVAFVTGHLFLVDWLNPLDGIVLCAGVAYWRGAAFALPL